MSTRRLLGALVLLVFALGGCMHKPATVRVYTPGVVVEAVDGSFRLAGSEPVPPPFLSRCWISVSGPGGVGLAHMSPGALAANPSAGVERRAQRVRVLTPGSSEPLHGLLAICTLNPGRGPARDLYSIAVPPELEAEAREGRVVVIRERYDTTNHWILWLSNQPF